MADAMLSEIKPEIKLERADAPLADVDEYEEDFTLQMPPDRSQAWLIKLPRDTWKIMKEIWDNADNGAPVEIGKMRVYNQEPGEEDPLKQRLEIRLHDRLERFRDIPKNYNVKLNTQGYSNTAVFWEKDIPGRRPNRFGRSNRNLHAPRAPTGVPFKSDRFRRGADFKYRTAIPKQTALAPMIHHEARADPIEDASYLSHLAQQWQKSVQPKVRTNFQTGIDRTLHPGMSHLSSFTSFSTSARPGGAAGAANRRAIPREKAVRMDQKDLLDALYNCFRKFKYWPLKALRQELKQPEAFIKEALDGIAYLIKSGDFAMTYALKPEFQSLADVNEEEVKEEAAKVESDVDTDVGVDEMEGDDGVFEDVKMEGT